MTPDGYRRDHRTKTALISASGSPRRPRSRRSPCRIPANATEHARCRAISARQQDDARAPWAHAGAGGRRTVQIRWFPQLIDEINGMPYFRGDRIDIESSVQVTGRRRQRRRSRIGSNSPECRGWLQQCLHQHAGERCRLPLLRSASRWRAPRFRPGSSTRIASGRRRRHALVLFQGFRHPADAAQRTAAEATA